MNFLSCFPSYSRTKQEAFGTDLFPLLLQDTKHSMGLFTYYVIIFLNSQTEFCDQRSSQMVVAVGLNIFEITGHRHRTPYSWPEAATVPCAQRAQYFISHR